MSYFVSLAWGILAFATVMVFLYITAEIERKARTKRRDAARAARREASALKKSITAVGAHPDASGN